MSRAGDWMQTYTGRAFWPLDPRPDEIDPRDIAHALGMICRYGGHVRRFYSVAEHCVLMSEWIETNWRALGEHDSLEWAREALLHDAAEAYLIDLPRPIKRQLPEYASIENRLLAMIFTRFGLEFPYSAEAKRVDNRILLDERAALLGPIPLPWGPELEALSPLGVEIHGWTPAEAEAAYLARLAELFPHVTEQYIGGAA